MTFTTLISTETLARHLDDPAFVIVDCRHNLADPAAGKRAYRAAHLPGAAFMHLDRDLSGAKTGTNGRHPLRDIGPFAAALGRAGVDADRQVVAYDQNNGMFASRLWWLLRWLGHDTVAVLDGGLDRWQAEGRPQTGAVPTPRARTFVPKAPTRVASAEEIAQNLGGDALLVLDARAAERYRGDVEPIDPVAGHIPAAQLRSEYQALLGPTLPSAVVHQCGSGVTACHNVLAMSIAGLPGSRLYPGSWSEWVADPARPVARG